MAIKGDEVLFDQPIAGPEVVIEREAQPRTALSVAVGRQPVAVCHQAEKPIAQACLLAPAAPEAIASEAMRDAGDAAGDLALAIWTKGLFFPPG